MQIVNRRLALMLVGAMFLTLAPLHSLVRAHSVINGRRHLRSSNAVVMKNQRFAFAIHGGAGTILKSNMTPEVENAYREKLNEALMAGYEILKVGGSSLNAVESAIRLMEDSPLFNAGKGAVFTSEGTIELDASVMDGKTLRAGAVAGVKHVKNPISLARLVMEKSPNVLMVGDGAEAFAKEKGVELVPVEYFRTERRWQELQRAREKEKQPVEQKIKANRALDAESLEVSAFGTVGAVALDRQGNLAAGTSTGGKTNKKFGRVGDSPIIGAGTYANNRTCAVSGTGDGEYFIRSVVAYDVSAMMEYKGMPLKAAADSVIEKVGNLGGTGGIIALDRDGN